MWFVDMVLKPLLRNESSYMWNIAEDFVTQCVFDKTEPTPDGFCERCPLCSSVRPNTLIMFPIRFLRRTMVREEYMIIFIKIFSEICLNLSLA